MTTTCDALTTPRTLLHMSALDLRPLPCAVPCARLHARQAVRDWGLPAIAAACELVVSELVTNAVLHGTAPGREDVPVRLRLTGRPAGVRIEVWDAGEKMPQLHADPLSGEPGGRGLVLVTAIASRWGAYRTKGGGKCVFAVCGT